MTPDLTPSQIRAAILISEGMEVKSVALSIGKSRRTIERWLLNHEFQDYLKSLKNQVFKRITTEENDQLLRIQKDHFECYEVLKNLALAGLNEPEISSKNALAWSQVLDKALIGQARISFLGMLELNAAIARIERDGYEVHKNGWRVKRQLVDCPPSHLIPPRLLGDD